MGIDLCIGNSISRINIDWDDCDLSSNVIVSIKKPPLNLIQPEKLKHSSDQYNMKTNDTDHISNVSKEEQVYLTKMITDENTI